MATNQSTITGLRQMEAHIGAIGAKYRAGQRLTPDDIDELAAWNQLLRRHLNRQQREPGGYAMDTYRYNPQTKTVERLCGGQVVAAP
jgi:hypothetical protein